MGIINDKKEKRIVIGLLGKCLKCDKDFPPSWGWIDSKNINPTEPRTELYVNTDKFFCAEHKALEKLSK